MNIKEMVEINIKKISRDDIVFNKKTRKWCKLPYPGHKKGCPNSGKNKLCPPFSKYLENDKKFNSYQYYYLIYANFNFKKYRKLRQSEHPNWTEKKVKCVLYWQSSVKKLLKTVINRFIEDTDMLFACGSGFNNSPSMESVGIQVFETYKNIGIEYEVKPKLLIVLSCLVCSNNTLLDKAVSNKIKYK